MITISEEAAIDYGLTARIATEAFAQADVVFSPERMRWLYESGFGKGATVVSAFDDGRKVGQVALIRQTLAVDGKDYSTVQLVDLFVLARYRSAHVVRRLYQEVEQICRARNIRYILTLPNEKSELPNARLLKLAKVLSLPGRIGMSLLWPASSAVRHSGVFKAMGGDRAEALFARFLAPPSVNGLRWDADTLFARLSDPAHDYGVHATDTTLLISTPRRIRGVRCTILCAFFARPRAAVSRRDVRHLIRSACRLWRTPLFVFAGINDALPRLPGVPLPARLRRPVIVQLRDNEREAPLVRLERLQLIDSDFA